jgi:hypothetical protein
LGHRSPSKETTVATTANRLSEFRNDRALVSVLYRSGLSTVVNVTGILLLFNLAYPARVQIPCALLTILVGIVIAVFAVIPGSRLLRAGHATRWVLSGFAVLVIVPLVLLLQQALTH